MSNVHLSTAPGALLPALSSPYHAASPSLLPWVALSPLAMPEMALEYGAWTKGVLSGNTPGLYARAALARGPRCPGARTANGVIGTLESWCRMWHNLCCNDASLGE